MVLFNYPAGDYLEGNSSSLLNCVSCMLNTCSFANVPCVLTCSRANVPCVLTCSHVNVPCVLTCSRVLCAYVLKCQRASFNATTFSFAAIVAEVVHTVGKV